MEIYCCPETSKDANGLTEVIEIRWHLMQLDVDLILSPQCQSSTNGGEIDWEQSVI